MSRTIKLVREVGFYIRDDLNPWQVNMLWGQHIMALHLKCEVDVNLLGHLEDYRFVASEDSISLDGKWMVYVTTDYEDSCFGDFILVKFIATVIDEEIGIEFYDDSVEPLEKWGYHISPGQVRKLEYKTVPGDIIWEASNAETGIGTDIPQS